MVYMLIVGLFVVISFFLGCKVGSDATFNQFCDKCKEHCDLC